MPLYIPWLTETIKKRGVRYLLHHYLGQFFEEKLTLEQLSIDIYEGKGSIKDLALDVDGLNDELDFIPFKFLDGCLIGQISVEVPWSSLATDACKVELEGAQFVCRLKTSVDGKVHCMESTILNRSLMTSSMQMAEDIVTRDDDDEEYQSPDSSFYGHVNHNKHNQQRERKRNLSKDQHSKQMFEGLEMFAQLIDSVLRRTKLTARNTLFRIEPQKMKSTTEHDKGDFETNTDSESAIDEDNFNDHKLNEDDFVCQSKLSQCDSNEYEIDSTKRTGVESRSSDNNDDVRKSSSKEDSKEQVENSLPNDTVEFLIRFFRCEEVIDNCTDGQVNNRTMDPGDSAFTKSPSSAVNHSDAINSNISAMPETVTKLLTLEDVEMRIGGVPVSNLVGKHTIMIKFNGQKSEISIFSGSPLLAVISHQQLKTFFNVFDSCAKDRSPETGGGNVCGSQLGGDDLHQQVMSPEDYAKIENQLLQSASFRKFQNLQKVQSQLSGRRWMGGQPVDHNLKGFGAFQSHRGNPSSDSEYIPSMSNQTIYQQQQQQIQMEHPCQSSHGSEFIEPSLDHIEAFSCQLKLPGIWLCLLLDGEKIPPLIKPYADSISSFQTINKYIDKHIKAPHIRCLALKVSLDITPSGINIFLGDLDITEHLKDPNFISPIIPILKNDNNDTKPTYMATHSNNSTSPTPSALSANQQQQGYKYTGERYKAKIVNNKDIVIESLTNTRLTIDPTLIDRLVYDYKLFDRDDHDRSRMKSQSGNDATTNLMKTRKTDFNFTVQLLGDNFKVELLCPIPDLTPEGLMEPTKIRPQSFLFDINGVKLDYEADKLTLIAQDGSLSIKSQPQQKDHEAIRFVEATSDFQNMVVLTLEPSPSRLECEFPTEADDPLNGSTMCGSIYIGQATESKIPTEAFATKRKLVRQSTKLSSDVDYDSSSVEDQNQTEKILTPGDREHLQNYLNQTGMSTKFSVNLHIPICKVQIEDKEQLDLIYNRFANDFVFWMPRILQKNLPSVEKQKAHSSDHSINRKISEGSSIHQQFRNPINASYSSLEDNHMQDDDNNDEDDEVDDELEDEKPNPYHPHNSYPGKPSSRYNNDLESDVSYHSFVANDMPSNDIYANEVTCKIIVDEISVIFNHQSCAAALRQEITSDNVLLGVVIDVNSRPNTILSMVTENMELSSDSNKVLTGNNFSMFSGNNEVISTFSFTAEIKRPAPNLKNIRLALQLDKGLFNDFKIDTFKRFWQSINVTDEPILGYVAPKIVTELHVNILNTGLMVARERLRPALLAADELYITSMVIEETNAPVAMLRVIAEEMSLYLKRNRKLWQPSDLRNHNVKNFVCLIDSGVIDLDVKLPQNGRVEFGMINNVINLRVCQDSLSALCKLITVLIASPEFKSQQAADTTHQSPREPSNINSNCEQSSPEERFRAKPTKRELELLEAAMNELGDNTSLDECTGAPISGTSNLSRSSSCDNEISDDSNSNIAEPNQILPGSDDTTSSDDDEVEDDSDDYATDEDEESLDEADNDDFDTELTSNTEASNQKTIPSENKQSHRIHQHHKRTLNCSKGSSSSTHCGRRNCNLTSENPCILDQSNPLLNELFLPPLMPSSPMRNVDNDSLTREPLIRSSELRSDEDDSKSTNDNENSSSKHQVMDESGFFVIGDDDVGAGILDSKQQKEPVIRQLIEGPITIIDDYFKITKPRTIPELLATSLERYLLEEMTLVVNLYGGHDLEDGEDDEDDLNLGLNVDGKRTFSTGSATNFKDSQSFSSTDTGFPVTPSTTATTSNPSSYVEAPTNMNKTTARRSLESESSAPNSIRKLHYNQMETAKDKQQQQQHQQQRRRKHLSEGSGSAPDYITTNDGSNGPGDGLKELGSKSVRFGEGAMNLWESLELSHSSDMLASLRQPNQFLMSPELKQAGGPSRQTDKSIQLYMSKIKCLYELAEPTREQPISWRFILLVQEIEIRDRLEASDINKMLYEYTNEQLPRRSVPQLTIKNVATINPTDDCEECDLRVSVKPLRLNVDQDTLLFLIDFFTNLTKSLQRRSGSSSTAAAAATHHVATSLSNSSPRASASSGSSQTGPVGARAKPRHQIDSESSGDGGSRLRSRTVSMSSEGGSSTGSNCAAGRFRHVGSETSSTSTIETNASANSAATKINEQHHKQHANSPATTKQAIYIKSFRFSPDVPIRVDYHAKHMDLQQGALAGILMGLADLDHSELIIRHLEAKHGMRGLDRVLLFALNHWLQDIKRNQVPSILSGIGPMHHVIDLFKGIRDLILMPIEQYRRDKRLVRGLQKGASSFSSSTAMAAISLMNRFISIIQCTAQIAHDIVTPPQLSKQLAIGGSQHQQSSRQQQQHRVGRSRSHRVQNNHSMSSLSMSSSSMMISSSGGRQNISGGATCLASAEQHPHNSKSNLSGASHSHHRHHQHHHHHRHPSHHNHHPIQALNQPRDFCEGVTVGFNIIREGLNDTARNIAMGMQAEDVRSAVGGIVRQIPSTLLNPIISATEGAQNVLVGMRNQIAPDARREDQEKWKRRVKGRG